MTELIYELRASLGRSNEELLSEWFAHAQRRCWQLNHKTITPFYERANLALQALKNACNCATSLHLGDAIFRETVQLFSFIGGWAPNHIPIGGVVALALGLEDTLGPRSKPLCDALTFIMSEAYAIGLKEKCDAEHRQVIEKSQWVTALSDGVVCLALVGDPDRQALDDAIGRLMMLAVMRDAKAIVVDGSALVTVDSSLPLVLSFIFDHREALSTRKVMICGLSAAAIKHIDIDSRLDVEVFERLDSALKSMETQ